MACTPFTLTVKDVKAAVAKVKKAIGEQKGTFTGDENSGAFSFSGSGLITGKYAIQGGYKVAGQAITITIDIKAERPAVVSCKAVEERVREWLK